MNLRTIEIFGGNPLITRDMQIRASLEGAARIVEHKRIQDGVNSNLTPARTLLETLLYSPIADLRPGISIIDNANQNRHITILGARVDAASMPEARERMNPEINDLLDVISVTETSLESGGYDLAISHEPQRASVITGEGVSITHSDTYTVTADLDRSGSSLLVASINLFLGENNFDSEFVVIPDSNHLQSLKALLKENPILASAYGLKLLESLVRPVLAFGKPNIDLAERVRRDILEQASHFENMPKHPDPNTPFTF